MNSTWRKAAAKKKRAEKDSAVLRDDVRPRTADESSNGVAQLPPSRWAGEVDAGRDAAVGEAAVGEAAVGEAAVGKAAEDEDGGEGGGFGPGVSPMAAQHRPITNTLSPKNN